MLKDIFSSLLSAGVVSFHSTACSKKRVHDFFSPAQLCLARCIDTYDDLIEYVIICLEFSYHIYNNRTIYRTI